MYKRLILLSTLLAMLCGCGNVSTTKSYTVNTDDGDTIEIVCDTSDGLSMKLEDTYIQFSMKGDDDFTGACLLVDAEDYAPYMELGTTVVDYDSLQSGTQTQVVIVEPNDYETDYAFWLDQSASGVIIAGATDGYAGHGGKEILDHITFTVKSSKNPSKAPTFPEKDDMAGYISDDQFSYTGEPHLTEDFVPDEEIDYDPDEAFTVKSETDEDVWYRIPEGYSSFGDLDDGYLLGSSTCNLRVWDEPFNMNLDEIAESKVALAGSTVQINHMYIILSNGDFFDVAECIHGPTEYLCLCQEGKYCEIGLNNHTDDAENVIRQILEDLTR